MKAGTRRAAGCGLLLVCLAIYALAAAAVGVSLQPVLPGWALMIYFAAAGIAWVFPLRPLFTWMNRPDPQ